MTSRPIVVLLLAGSLAQAAIVDRVAIVVGNRIVKDSDIEQDLRITAFLNDESPASSPDARKKAAGRLVDQTFIRTEVESGDYPSGSVQEAESLLADLKKRYANDTAYKKALASYGLTEEDVKSRLRWQLTALRFIDTRFRPAAFVTDDEIQKYYEGHARQLQAGHAGQAATLDALRGEIQDILAGERINQLLDEWLNSRREASKIAYLEEGLK